MNRSERGSSFQLEGLSSLGAPAASRFVHPKGVQDFSPGLSRGTRRHPGLRNPQRVDPKGVTEGFCDSFRVGLHLRSWTQGVADAAQPWAKIWDSLGVLTPHSSGVRA